jgi:cell division protein FtsQ
MNMFSALSQATLMVLRGVIALTVIAGLIWGSVHAWRVWQTYQHGDLIHIDLINPSEHVSSQAMQGLLRPYSGLSFWQLDLPMIRQVVESHPWVSKADVYRYWPNRLKIEVTEHIAVARWGDDELINQRGELFKPTVITGVDDLIQLSSLTAKPKDMLIMLKDMLNVINPYGLHIRQLVQLADGSWQVFLISGDEWYLPAKDAMLSLKRLLALYGSIPAQENSKMRIDLRYRDGFAVKWQIKSVESTVDASTGYSSQQN